MWQAFIWPEDENILNIYFLCSRFSTNLSQYPSQDSNQYLHISSAYKNIQNQDQDKQEYSRTRSGYTRIFKNKIRIYKNIQEQEQDIQEYSRTRSGYTIKNILDQDLDCKIFKNFQD